MNGMCNCSGLPETAQEHAAWCPKWAPVHQEQRFHAACAAMQGLIAASDVTRIDGELEKRILAVDAVECADELLKALDGGQMMTRTVSSRAFRARHPGGDPSPCPGPKKTVTVREYAVKDYPGQVSWSSEALYMDPAYPTGRTHEFEVDDE